MISSAAIYYNMHTVFRSTSCRSLRLLFFDVRTNPRLEAREMLRKSRGSLLLADLRYNATQMFAPVFSRTPTRRLHIPLDRRLKSILK